MVSRKQKLLAAGLAMAVGCGLAWPFRRREPVARQATAPAPTQAAPAPQSLAGPQSLDPAPAARQGVPATMAGLVEKSTAPLHGGPSEDTSPKTADWLNGSGGPAPPADIAQELPSGDAAPPVDPAALRTHIVGNGDSLERLAKRYLGDESRALELFDLNRDQLTNPHLLPIGAELRIPARASAVD